jgi:hypothetical protein
VVQRKYKQVILGLGACRLRAMVENDDMEAMRPWREERKVDGYS